MFDAKKVKDECVAWIRDFFEKNGPGCNAVLGISGGKDSSVVAALCVEALGKDRVIGVLMPCGDQPDIDMSYLLETEEGKEFYNKYQTMFLEAKEATGQDRLDKIMEEVLCV